MFACYAKVAPEGLLVRTGHKVKTFETACRRARTLQALEVEVRAEHLPHHRNLMAVFKEGVQICSH